LNDGCKPTAPAGDGNARSAGWALGFLTLVLKRDPRKGWMSAAYPGNTSPNGQ
jgi:hypothetical protein